MSLFAGLFCQSRKLSYKYGSYTNARNLSSQNWRYTRYSHLRRFYRWALWCCSKYPTFNEDLKKFPKKFSDKDYFGYSDHTIGIETCLMAISRGAKIIEKHFTLDKSNNTIRDHALSATPSEFRSLVNLGREINKKVNLGI